MEITKFNKMSYKERVKDLLCRFGDLSSVLFGVCTINFTLDTSQSQRSGWKSISRIYTNLLNFILICVLPVYFGYKLEELLEAFEKRAHLRVALIFCNIIIKYISTVVNSIANLTHYDYIRQLTYRRMLLEEHFGYSRKPELFFLRMIITKFVFYNVSVLVQVLNMILVDSINKVARLQVAIYYFVLCNVTECIVLYIFYINCCAGKFYAQTQEQLQELYKEVDHLRRSGTKSIAFQQRCTHLERVVDALSNGCRLIYNMLDDNIKLHQFQILAQFVSTVMHIISNAFNIFYLVVAGTPENKLEIKLSVLYAVVFTANTVLQVSMLERIKLKVYQIHRTLQDFSEFGALEKRLDAAVCEVSVFGLCNFSNKRHFIS